MDATASTRGHPLPIPRLTVPAEQMTPRARGYLLVATGQWYLIGFAMILRPDSFDSPAFKTIFDVAPRPFWIVALLLGGTHLLYACVRGSEGHSRSALTFSAAVAFMWATALLYAIEAGAASVLVLAFCVGSGMRDLIACAQPLRSPFERLAFLLSEEHHPPAER